MQKSTQSRSDFVNKPAETGQKDTKLNIIAKTSSPKITRDEEIHKISKMSLGIRPLSMGVPLPRYATPILF